MANMHATGVVLGDRGVLIAGASGTGKTGLALALLSQMRAAGLFARLVSDDQVLLEVHHGRLLMAAPGPIAGLAEIRGMGPRPVGFERRAPVDLLVRLTEAERAERFPQAGSETLAGCPVPLLTLAGGDRDAAAFAVASGLGLPPFA